MSSDFSSERLRRNFHSRWFDDKRLVLITSKGSKHLMITRRFQLTVVGFAVTILGIACILGFTSLFFYFQQQNLREKTQKVEQDLVEFSNQLQELNDLNNTGVVFELPDGHVLKNSYVKNYIENLHTEMNKTNQFSQSYLTEFTKFLAFENDKILKELKKIDHRLPKIALKIGEPKEKFTLNTTDSVFGGIQEQGEDVQSGDDAFVDMPTNGSKKPNIPNPLNISAPLNLENNQPIENNEYSGNTMEASDDNAPHQNRPDKNIPDIVKDLQESRQGYIKILQDNKALKKFVSLLPSKYPLKEYWQSSDFGRRKHPVTGRLQMHQGVDLVAQRRTRVKVPLKGVVTFSGKTEKGGIMVYVRHAGNVETRYGHLDKATVRKGDEIDAGHTVGLLGNSGYSTGPHIHFEVLVNKFYIDPEQVVNLRQNLYK